MISRTIAFAFLFAIAAIAQQGLPRHGVLLEGTPSSPIIVNNSSHRILAYTLLFDQGGSSPNPATYSLLGQLRRQPSSAVGIAPGARYTHQSTTQVRDASGQSLVQRAVALDSVLFDDGTLVGPDKAGSFEQHTARIQAEKDVHALLLSANGAQSGWAAIERIASSKAAAPLPPNRSQMYQFHYQSASNTFAMELLNLRSRAGDAAALDLARSSTSYPTIVKGAAE